MNPDAIMCDVAAAIPDDAPPAAVALALIGAGVLLLERAGDGVTAGAVLGALERVAN